MPLLTAAFDDQNVAEALVGLVCKLCKSLERMLTMANSIKKRKKLL